MAPTPSSLPRLLLALALLVATTAPSLAAPGTMEQAKAHFKRGVAAYEKEQWDDAVEAFQAAYDLSKSPDILFNISRAVTRKGDEEAAIGYLKRYLEAAPNAPDAVSVRAEIEARERGLRDRKDTARAEAEAAEARRVAEAAAVDAAKAREEAARAQRPSWPGWLLAGAGFAALGVGVGLGAVALQTARAAETGGNGGTEKFDLTIQSRGRTAQNAGIALDAVGGATLAAGVGLLVWAYRGRAGEPARKITIAPGFGSVMVGGRF